MLYLNLSKEFEIVLLLIYFIRLLPEYWGLGILLLILD